jgi:dUTP pyrophosphatase
MEIKTVEEALDINSMNLEIVETNDPQVENLNNEEEESSEEDGDNLFSQFIESLDKNSPGGMGSSEDVNPMNGNFMANMMGMLMNPNSMQEQSTESSNVFEVHYANEETMELYNGREQNEEDSGFDLHFPETIEIPGNTYGKLVDLRITIVMKDSFGKTNGFYMMPRSSIYKTPIRQSNSIGVIDRGYRNTLRVPIDNLSSEPYVIEKGTRMFQIVNPNLQPTVFKVVDEVDVSDARRGLGGFGSSGKK